MITSDFYKSLGVEDKSPLERNQRVKFNRYIFTNIFVPRMTFCESNGRKLSLTKRDRKLIEDFAMAKVVAKTKESNGFDNQMRAKREMTGACIEYAVLKFYGKEECFDNSIVEKSAKKNHPDLLPLGILCDIKGSSINNVPLVFKTSRSYVCSVGEHAGRRYRCSNVIGITDNDSVWLMGIATPTVLETCVDDNLMMIAENTSKTGFYGAHELVNLPESWSDFKVACSNLSLVS